MSYNDAKKKYAKIGIDTDKAIAILAYFFFASLKLICRCLSFLVLI